MTIADFQNMSDQVKQPLFFAGSARRLILAAVLAGFGTAACEEVVDVRGNMPHPAVVSQIKPGFHKKSDVENMLGTPSAVATFKKETWYYIGGRVKTVAFFKPEVLDRKVVIVRFDKKGIVSKINARNVAKDKKIHLVERETPTKGKDLTIIQQLIGNLGRFGNPGQEDASNQ
ncbi:MAG: outer membrane protein assembly factor BamE [Rhodospirillaceae bacterium]|mgnify:CR=1 FL=1|jgi:outer membrane protein assembly factor BamE (lipoprotein component of BamABCDE complex)|nr:outer membrane protein assembly factor BamE [Rhodospirillaceae bacterium]MBT5458811.1 outer membrane protein assembly factor BamE [Rhodospirillaceae bacterium]